MGLVAQSILQGKVGFLRLNHVIWLKWKTSRQNPLTAKVWGFIFAAILDNFGGRFLFLRNADEPGCFTLLTVPLPAHSLRIFLATPLLKGILPFSSFGAGHRAGINP